MMIKHFEQCSCFLLKQINLNTSYLLNLNQIQRFSTTNILLKKENNLQRVCFLFNNIYLQLVIEKRRIYFYFKFNLK